MVIDRGLTKRAVEGVEAIARLAVRRRRYLYEQCQCFPHIRLLSKVYTHDSRHSRRNERRRKIFSEQSYGTEGDVNFLGLSATS